MQDILKMDVFFVITSVSVIVVAVGLVVALFYLIRILRNVRYVSDKVRIESDEILKDVDLLRQEIKEKGFKMSGILSLFSFFNKKRKNKKVNK